MLRLLQLEPQALQVVLFVEQVAIEGLDLVLTLLHDLGLDLLQDHVELRKLVLHILALRLYLAHVPRRVLRQRLLSDLLVVHHEQSLLEEGQRVAVQLGVYAE